MNVRKCILPAGWYPHDSGGASRQIDSWAANLPESERNARAGIVPHAGWYFSGEIACRVIESLDYRADTVVVVGGHLPKGAGFLAAPENEYETPLGNLSADRELIRELEKTIPVKPDRYDDNTVEVQLPFVRYFFPSAKALWVRAEHSAAACALGRALKKAADRLSRRLVVIGSTDLTHYGLNYGFSPAGTGEKAVAWVKEVNDKRFIDTLIAMQCEEALEVSSRDHSACSAGGAVSALAFAEMHGIKNGKVLEYRTSYDIQPSESFVGYVGILYRA